MKHKIKQIISIITLVVMVLSLTAGSACTKNTNPSSINSWGVSWVTSMPQTSGDYINEFNSLNDAFTDIQDLLDELLEAITAAENATIACGDITLEILAAIEDDDTAAIINLIAEGEEILELAGPVYDRLIDAIDAVKTKLDEINDIKNILDTAGQDTSGYSTGNIDDILDKGELAATNLKTAMDTLEQLLDMEAADTIVEQNTIDSSFDQVVLIADFGDDARYVKHTQEIDVREMFVTAMGASLLSYQWYVSWDDNNTTGSPIANATSRTFKPITQTLGTFYYYCVVSSPGLASVASPTITVNIFDSQQTLNLNLTITTQPQSAQYTQGATAKPLTVATTVTQGASLSYQWYSRVLGGANIQIPGATSASYTPPTDKVGIVDYFCEVSSTLNNRSVVLNSNAATVTVTAPALTPTLTASPETINQNPDDSFPVVTYTYYLGKAEQGVHVEFTVPGVGEGVWTPSAELTAKLNENFVYTGTTDADGKITFTMNVVGFDRSDDYNVSATDTTYNNTVTETLSVTINP